MRLLTVAAFRLKFLHGFNSFFVQLEAVLLYSLIGLVSKQLGVEPPFPKLTIDPPLHSNLKTVFVFIPNKLTLYNLGFVFRIIFLKVPIYDFLALCSEFLF